MDIQTLTTFFMWCTIMSGGLLILSSLLLMVVSDFAYPIHAKMFSISRETYNVACYSFIGLFKILFLIFNLIPYVALLIIG